MSDWMDDWINDRVRAWGQLLAHTSKDGRTVNVPYGPHIQPEYWRPDCPDADGAPTSPDAR